MSSPDDVLKESERRIAWALAHPGFSNWLKDALRDARARDPVEVLNELEILIVLLRTDCEARLRAAWPEEQVLSSEGEAANSPRD